ncbi:MAG: hypothetical protein LUF27_10625 [Lachnospiraceae bacterium]|nr:hypothetical protein [Lachnospiraceae bacterium]
MNRQMKPQYSNKAAAALKKELRGYERAGTRLYLEGRRCHADEIVSACLFAEDSAYMRDFIGNDQETITGINFVKIRLDRS